MYGHGDVKIVLVTVSGPDPKLVKAHSTPCRTKDGTTTLSSSGVFPSHNRRSRAVQTSHRVSVPYQP